MGKPERRMKRPRSFVPGESRQNRAGRKGPMPSKILSDMRKVYRSAPNKDVTESQKKLRQWYDDDPKGFFKELAQLERTFVQNKERSQTSTNGFGSSEPEPEEKRDIGTERCEELTAYLLKQYGEEPEEEQQEPLKETFEGTE